MEKIVQMSPAYDRRNDPRGNFGIHGVDLRMILKGEKGAVQFVLYTNWQLPKVSQEQDNGILREARTGQLNDISLRCTYHPLAADLGYHSPTPRYEDQDVCQQSCEYLDGKPCYYDGSGLNAERIYTVLLTEGSDGVWGELEAYYHRTFETTE